MLGGGACGRRAGSGERFIMVGEGDTPRQAHDVSPGCGSAAAPLRIALFGGAARRRPFYYTTQHTKGSCQVSLCGDTDWHGLEKCAWLQKASSGPRGAPRAAPAGGFALPSPAASYWGVRGAGPPVPVPDCVPMPLPLLAWAAAFCLTLRSAAALSSIPARLVLR